MADSYIQVAPDSTGKKLQTYENLVSGQTVEAEAVVLVDNSGNYLSTLPVSVSANINVPNVNLNGPITVEQSNASNFLATVSGTVTANQGGTWNIGSITSNVNVNGTFWQATQPVSGPLTNTELRASNVNVAGTFWQATQPVSGPITNAELRASAVTVIQSNAANFLATVNQGGTWNIGTVTAIPNINVSRFTGAATMFNGQVAATNAAATLVSARATRRSVVIRNHDATNSGYIGLAVISASNGMLVQAKESISLDYTGLIQVITASGNANFGYIETFD